jgi:hypothetical protein
MKICHYNKNQAGVVVGNKVINFGDALIKAGLARQSYTMPKSSTPWRTTRRRCKSRAMRRTAAAARPDFGEAARADPKSRSLWAAAATMARTERKWSNAWAAQTRRSSTRMI